MGVVSHWVNELIDELFTLAVKAGLQIHVLLKRLLFVSDLNSKTIHSVITYLFKNTWCLQVTLKKSGPQEADC